MDYLTGLSNRKDHFYKDVLLDKDKIGKRIVYIRTINNIKQKDLALFLNTSPSTLWAYEKGVTLMLTAFLYQIAKKYKISIDWLIGASPNMKRI